MNVPIKWLEDFVDINVGIEELCNALTMSEQRWRILKDPVRKYLM